MRNIQGWSQTQLAEQIGSHLSHINRIETGKYNPSLDVVQKPASVFDVSIDYLARETGISQRMIAYYEKQTQYPPTHLLPILTEVLGASADELLGIKKMNSDGKKKDMRLWRRFSQIEKLDAKEKRQILQLLDAFIEKEQLKRKIQSG